MAVTTEIPWGDGSGDKIYLTRNASEGDQVVSVSSDANTGAARSKVVTFASGVGNIQRQLTINQAAGREEHTITLSPSSYDSSNYSYYSTQNISNGYTRSSSNNYSTINLKRGSNAETYFFYKFDTSAIPENATIVSVECSAKAYIDSTTSSIIATRELQLYSGTDTQKGTGITITNPASVGDFSIVQWTREEVRDIRIRIYAKRGSTNPNSNHYIRFFGATLTIKYIV